MWNMKVTVIPILICVFGMVIKSLVKGLGCESKGTSRYYPNYNIVEIGHNTEKGPGDL